MQSASNTFSERMNIRFGSYPELSQWNYVSLNQVIDDNNDNFFFGLVKLRATELGKYAQAEKVK